MIAESEHAQVWECEEWNPAPALPKGRTRKGIEICPYVGLRLPSYPTEYSLKAAWFSKQELRSWYIKPLRRRALYNLMRRNLHNWAGWLRLDSTHTFNRELKDYQKFNDGATVGITGPKGSGKSRLAQMVLNRAVDTTPHVIFEYKDLEINIPQRGKEAVGIQVDENLKATGSDSKNLVIHVNNALDTGRKAELWVICTGINLSFQGWGDTLDIRMIPFGFNRRFQATRAAFFDVKNDFLGFCVLQREHTPKDSVYYYSELGTWGEYEARARQYSLKVTRKGGATDAIDDTMQDRHIAALKDYLKANFLAKGLDIPSDLKCRRLYRKCKLPPKSVGYMNEIIVWAKDDLEDSKTEKPVFVPQVTEGWNGLRDAFRDWLRGSVRLRKESARYLADWYIATGETQAEIGAKYDRGVDAVNKAVGRYTDSFAGRESEYGEIAERWVQAHTESLGARQIGGPGRPDVIVNIEDVEVALNVKLCLEETFRRDFTTSPECEWDHGVLVVVHAFAKYKKVHRPVIRLYPITGYQTYAHWEKGAPCAPEELADRLREMIEK